MAEEPKNLGDLLVAATAGLPAAISKSALGALNRLIAGATDIPATYLAGFKEHLEDKNYERRKIRRSLVDAAAAKASQNDTLIDRTIDRLLNEQTRKQANREAVARETITLLAAPETKPAGEGTGAGGQLEEEWLNVFERYAEEASTERMQKLWGRVLAGEVRKSGSFSMRSMRFLSEFSQSDALNFAKFCENVFGECVPKSLVIPDIDGDIRHLLSLQAADLVDGIDGNGLRLTIKFDENGFGWLREEDLVLLLTGTPGDRIEIGTYALTPIGRELVNLLDRDRRECARRVAAAIRTPAIKAAHLAIPAGENRLTPIEVLWTEASTPTEQ